MFVCVFSFRQLCFLFENVRNCSSGHVGRAAGVLMSGGEGIRERKEQCESACGD